jgi:hypothetical protein
MATLTVHEGPRMETLIDPFELASTLPRPATRPRDVAATLIDIDVQLEGDAQAAQHGAVRESAPPGPDSSARLRCWCSED